VQTGEAALDEVNSILVHMRELAVDSANVGVNDSNAMAANQAEVDNALATLDRIARDTAFGTKKLLDGSAANSVTFADGTNTTLYATFSNSTLDTGTHSLQLSAVADANWEAENATVRDAMGITGNLAAADQDVKGLTAGTHVVKVTQASAAAAITGDVTLKNAANEEFRLQVKDAAGADVTSADLVINHDYTLETTQDLVDDINTLIAASAVADKAEAYVVDANTIGFRSTSEGSGASVTILSPATGTDALAAGNILEGYTNNDTDAGTDAIVELDGSANTVSFIEGDSGETATVVTLVDGDDGQLKFEADTAGLNIGNLVVDIAAATGTATLYDDDGGSGGTGTPGTPVTFTADQAFTIGAYGGGSMGVTIGNQILLQGVAAASSYEDLTVVDNALVFQIGGDRNQTVSLSLLDVGSDTLAQNITNDSGFASLADIDVTTAQGAQDALLLVDRAIAEVTDVRTDIGSFQANTLESQINNLKVAAENMTAARSAIVDADFAAEVSEFTKQQIILQAGMQVLASAGQIPQLVLSLLR
jgi:flagellin